jgi:hypothetical protein
MGKAEVGQFLTALAVERHVAASTQNQALAAINLGGRGVQSPADQPVSAPVPGR